MGWIVQPQSSKERITSSESIYIHQALRATFLQSVSKDEHAHIEVFGYSITICMGAPMTMTTREEILPQCMFQCNKKTCALWEKREDVSTGRSTWYSRRPCEGHDKISAVRTGARIGTYGSHGIAACEFSETMIAQEP
jgi:hypothetical protein